MLTDDQRQAIREFVDLRDVYLDLVDRPLLRGKCCRCPNPSHDDVIPSASIDATGWHCHACGSKGDAIGLVQLVTGCTFAEAANTVLSRLGDRLAARGITQPAAPGGLHLRDTTKYLTPPSEARIEAMRRVWQVVAGSLRHNSLCAGWLESRGLDVATAIELGCTDWRRVGWELERELARWPDQLRAESGLYGSGGRVWWPLANLLETDNHGLAIPCHHPIASWPIAYRWRWTRPERVGPRQVKAHAMFGPVYPVGLRTHGQLLPSAIGASISTVFLCEGEPDWLAVHTAVASQPRWRDAIAAVSICDVAGGLKNEVIASINPKARIILAVHDNAATATMQRDFLHLVPGGRGKLALVPESQDLNDKLQAGTLVQWMREVLG
jgi:hypothetical protein